jgi:iron complex outermembrane recepter protein
MILMSGRHEKWRVLAARASAALLLLMGASGMVRAQHAADDPVASASDAFGLTLGLETIGLYGPGYVRGFNPQSAGNVRIEGLYFDQQGALSNRVVEGSTIRIGVSEVGYAFPSPTGIVDYDLRSTGNGTPSATVVVSGGPFEARGASVDAVLPLNALGVRLPVGASYEVSTQTLSGPNPGYTSDIANVGATPEWKPNGWLTVRAIFDWTQTTHALTLPSVLMGGDYLPPLTPRGYYGQNWAQGRNLAENYGGIVSAHFTETWSLAAGIFRSISDSPVSYADLYLDTQPDGLAQHFMVGNPDQKTASTSGEARLTGHFGAGNWRQDVVFLARGRDTLALYGGYDVVDLGPTTLDQGTQVPEPPFSYGALTHDRTEIGSAGIAYRAQWKNRADFAFGVQEESYSKEVTAPGAAAEHLSYHPLRAYGTFAFALNAGAGRLRSRREQRRQPRRDPAGCPHLADRDGAALSADATTETDSGRVPDREALFQPRCQRHRQKSRPAAGAWLGVVPLR